MISGGGSPAGPSIEIGIGIGMAGRRWPFRIEAACDHRSLPRACILAIDRLLRRYYGVHEFSAIEENLLRMSLSSAKQRITLRDGTEIAVGDVVIDVHLWNERIPALGSFRSGLGWGSRAARRIERSLALLAAHVEADPSLAQCKALRVDAVFLPGRRAATLPRIAERLGLGAPVAVRPADAGHTLLALALGFACHPGNPTSRRWRAARYTFWVSRQALCARYRPACGPRVAAAFAPGETTGR